MLLRCNAIRALSHQVKFAFTLSERLVARFGNLHITRPLLLARHITRSNSQHEHMKKSDATDTRVPVHERKYCMLCGRLISPNHRNFEERKYCSKYCSSTRLQAIDRELEKRFRTLARERGQISCDEMQQLFSGEEEATEHRRHGVPMYMQTASPDASRNILSQDTKHKAGMDLAKWRERVRRAGRRVIAQSTADFMYECVQKGKVVEPSYAKGDWSVRLVKH